jgi:hypothetical protein
LSQSAGRVQEAPSQSLKKNWAVSAIQLSTCFAPDHGGTPLSFRPKVEVTTADYSTLENEVVGEITAYLKQKIKTLGAVWEVVNVYC